MSHKMLTLDQLLKSDGGGICVLQASLRFIFDSTDPVAGGRNASAGCWQIQSGPSFGNYKKVPNYQHIHLEKSPLNARSTLANWVSSVDYL